MKDFNRSFGIILGIDAYQNGVPKLSTAAADAEELSRILTDKHEYECFLRTDHEVTLSGVKKLLDEDLPQLVTKDDRVLFYFAGHGVATNGDDGPEGYLLLQDARPDDERTFLQMTELNQSLCALQCRHMLVILDCCFAGAFRWSSIRTLRPVPKVIYREQYEYFVKDPAWQTIASSAYDQTASNKRHETDKHSPFAKALFAGLLGEADVFPPVSNNSVKGDGIITATELYLYLRAAVEGAPGAFPERQTPTLWPIHRKHGKGEFIFHVPDRKAQLPPAPPLNRDNNPYRGLMPYDVRHRELFFGRQRAITDLTARVTEQALTVVVGASGTGKSSLVKARLLPRLRDVAENWHILSPLRPGKNPLHALANLLVSGRSHFNRRQVFMTCLSTTRERSWPQIFDTRSTCGMSALASRWGRGLASHGSNILAVAFCKDGKKLVSGGVDKQVIVWDVDLNSWRNRTQRIANRPSAPTNERNSSGLSSCPRSLGSKSAHSRQPRR